MITDATYIHIKAVSNMIKDTFILKEKGDKIRWAYLIIGVSTHFFSK